MMGSFSGCRESLDSLQVFIHFIMSGVLCAQWNRVFEDLILTEVVIDRLIYHSHSVFFTEESKCVTNLSHLICSSLSVRPIT